MRCSWLLLGIIMGVYSVPLQRADIAQNVLELPTEHPAASLPASNPTRSFWIDTPNANPLAKEGSGGALTDDADVCIIGSGITGVSAAYHLSKSFAERPSGHPIKTVILEARDFCSGATGRNGGHLTPAVFLDFHDREAMYGTEQAVRSFTLENYTSAEIVKILETEQLGDAVDLVAGGHVSMLVTEREVQGAQADYAAAKAAGLDLSAVEWVSKDEMEEKYGASYPGYRFLGHNLWPLKVVTELYKLAQKKSLTSFSLNLHTRTPVTSVDAIPSSASSPRRWALSTPRGKIQCSYVIHATNAYASHLLPHMRGPAGIIPTRGQVIALRADVPLAELTTSSWDGNEGFEYWFPRPVKVPRETANITGHPLVILGGGREAAEPEFEYYETDDSVVHPGVGEALKGFLPQLFPGKFEEGREPEMEWTGIMGYTKLKDPFVGPVLDKSNPDKSIFKGQFIAAGYTGHGMPRAYACAEAVAGMVIAEITGEEWIVPAWLPEHFLTWARS